MMFNIKCSKKLCIPDLGRGRLVINITVPVTFILDNGVLPTSHI